MRIISHRGFWLSSSEKNTITAFRRSFESGFGTETDIRDSMGTLVISHDPPVGGELSLLQFIELHQSIGKTLPVAFNVKADGLQISVKEVLDNFGMPNFFFFDMSIPDAVGYLRLKLPFYTRQSDYEAEPLLYEGADGVWLDGFNADWFEEAVVEKHLNAGKNVCIVSSELHGRDQNRLWERLASWSILSHPKLTLCTDYPVQARNLLSE